MHNISVPYRLSADICFIAVSVDIIYLIVRAYYLKFCILKSQIVYWYC